MRKIANELERFYAVELARGRKPDSVAHYRGDVASLLAFLAKRGKEDLREATREDLVAYARDLDRRYARATVRLRLWRLRRVLFSLLKAGLLLRNPASDLQRKPTPSKMRAWLTERETQRLLEVPKVTTDKDVRDRAAIELLYSAGLRHGELRRLELDDLDLAEGLVTVKESKSGRGRRVPIGRVAVSWLTRYLREVRPRLLATRRPTTVVFLSERGTSPAKGTLDHHLRRCAEAAGIGKTVTAHVLRHTFAVHLLSNGASTRHIQEMLGHRSLEATQIYARVLPADLRRAHRKAHPSDRLPRRRERG